MGQTLTEKILSAHLVEGEMVKAVKSELELTRPLQDLWRYNGIS